MDEPPPTVLLIAGLDPSGGAGLLADTRIVLASGLHPIGVATALTEQDSRECVRMNPVAAEVIAAQLARLVDDFAIKSVKIGMLATADNARAVAHSLRALDGVPVVLDPVLRATRGVALLDGDAREALAPLLRLATVVTPNVDELAALGGVDALRDFGTAVLAKGGHLPGAPIDRLYDEQGEVELPGERIPGEPPHGTGCALSTEIACGLALGLGLRGAVQLAVVRVRERIRAARAIGRGRRFVG
jgi:hydroxymethylpyrimidine/phosphomethylpyrimidine kinase